MLDRTNSLMDPTVESVTPFLSESRSFCLKSVTFMAVVTTLLFVSLAVSYPAVHDAMHGFRHALAVVPCH